MYKKQIRDLDDQLAIRELGERKPTAEYYRLERELSRIDDMLDNFFNKLILTQLKLL